MRPLIAKTRTIAGLTMAGLVLIVILAVSLPFVRLADNALRDFLLTTASPWTTPPKDIVIVAITEDTLKDFAYRSPIDRGFLARILTKILAAGPKVVGLDILFDQATEPAKDEALRAVLKSAPHPVIIAYADAANGLTSHQSAYLAHFSEGLATGAVDIAKDRADGTVRNFLPGHDHGDQWHPSLVAAMAATQAIPVPRQALPMTYYRRPGGEPYAFPEYPAQTVALLPTAWFKDKYVLIGTDLPADDRHRTPFALINGPARGTLAGVVIHAQALAQIIAGDHLTLVRGPLMGLLTAFLVGLSIAVAYVNASPYRRVLLVLLLLLALWGAGFAMFHYRGTYVHMVLPSLAIAIANGLASTHLWYRDRQERRFIENAFSHYVSPAYVHSLIAHPEQLRLGGERREVTYVFTDIAGFTTLAESTDPEVMSRLLNSYLDGLCGLFLEHGATIDKLIGDAVVGFFGAPIEQPDHAERAVSLVLAIDAFSQSFRKTQAENGLALGVTRIGAHTGPAIIGNFGGKKFFDYTGLGDTVNTAARLEGANKVFGTRVCVSGPVAALSPAHRFRPIASVVLKGKHEAVDVLQPLGPDSLDGELEVAYRAAYALIERGDASALAAVEDLAARWPDDPLVEFHLQRLRRGETGVRIAMTEK